jgi:hypothetical protein
MRTTIELPDPLFQRAKMVALQRRLTLKELISLSLQRELEADHPAPRRMTAPPISGRAIASVPALSNAEIAGLMDDEEFIKTGR